MQQQMMKMKIEEVETCLIQHHIFDTNSTANIDNTNTTKTKIL